MDVIDWNFNKPRPALEVRDNVYLNADAAGDAAQPEIEKKLLGNNIYRWVEEDVCGMKVKKYNTLRNDLTLLSCGKSYFV